MPTPGWRKNTKTIQAIKNLKNAETNGGISSGS